MSDESAAICVADDDEALEFPAGLGADESAVPWVSERKNWLQDPLDGDWDVDSRPEGGSGVPTDRLPFDEGRVLVTCLELK